MSQRSLRWIVWAMPVGRDPKVIGNVLAVSQDAAQETAEREHRESLGALPALIVALDLQWAIRNRR